MDLEVKNIDLVAAKLARDLNPGISSVAILVAELIRDDLTPYAPATEANSPGRLYTYQSGGKTRTQIRWYERGFGPRWIRKRDGTVGGRKTSENLLRSWSTTPTPPNGATLASAASYSGVVHRDPQSQGQPKQARFHGKRGWRTDRASIARVLRSGALRQATSIIVESIVK